MAKTRRMIGEYLPKVDIVLELLDARIPRSSENPEIAKLVGSKPVVTLLTKASLADPNVTARWRDFYTSQGLGCAFVDCITGEGFAGIVPEIRRVLSDKVEKYESRGMSGKALRAMVLGIPNVGKSSLINRMAGAKKARVEDRPGVTLAGQWVKTSSGVELLDMPGVLWPKFDDKIVGENLAMTGAIKDTILDIEELAVKLCARLRKFYPNNLCERYKLGGAEDIAGLEDWELFELIGRKRGFLISGGEVSYERTAVMLLDEFRAGRIGRITLEIPPIRQTVKNKQEDSEAPLSDTDSVKGEDPDA